MPSRCCTARRQPFSRAAGRGRATRADARSDKSRLEDVRPLGAYDACSSSGSTAGSTRTGRAYSVDASSQTRLALTAGLVIGVPIFPITYNHDDQ